MSSKKKKDDRIEQEYYDEVVITDTNGNILKQKVKVIRYKSIAEKIIGNKGVLGEEELEEEFEKELSGDQEWSEDSED